MLIALSSINSYLKRKVSAQRLTSILSRTEVEVESVSSPISYSDKLVVARTLTVEKHPDADRLKIVTIEVGQADQLEIVCGAPNVEKDQLVIVATPGAVLPDGTKISKSKIRGVTSNGMLCSERELSMSENHDGIYILQEEIAPGTKLCDIVKDDVIVDVKTPPNRWDLQSYWGIARHVAAFDERGDNQIVDPPHIEKHINTTKKKYVNNGEEASRFMAVKMAVNNSVKTPEWVVDNLQGSGMRSVSPVVDFTNFVMLELGQPTHAYDASRLRGDIQLRSALPSEKVTTLDGRERKLNPEDLVIADDSQVLGLAGIMGGIDSEVNEQTTEIILEIATFNGSRVRRSAIAHGLRSDASARFERGLSPHLAEIAMSRLIELMSQYCQAKLLSPVFDDFPKKPTHVQVGLRIRRAEKVIGMRLDETKLKQGFARLGFTTEHFSLTHSVQELVNQVEKDDTWDTLNKIYTQIGLPIIDSIASLKKSAQPIDSDKLRAGDVLVLQARAKSAVRLVLYLTRDHVVALGGQNQDSSSSVERTSHRDYQGAYRLVENFNHILTTTAPWWRTDIRLEEDMIEEAAKLIGYDAIPLTLPDLPATTTSQHSLLTRSLELKQMLVARGLYEVMSYAFVSKKALQDVGQEPDEHLQIHNPLTIEQEYLRSDLLSSHLQAIQANTIHKEELGFYEISHVYVPVNGMNLPDERTVVGMSQVGSDSFLRTAAHMYAVASFAGITIELRPENISAGINGRSFGVYQGENKLGYITQINPKTRKAFDITPEVAFAKLELDEILRRPIQIKACDVAPYQLVVRDLSIAMPQQVLWQDIVTLLQKQTTLRNCEFLSEYFDDSLRAAHERKLALRLSFDLGPNPTQEQIKEQVAIFEHALQQLAKHGQAAT